MEKKTVFIILRALRLLFLIIVLGLIISGAGGRESCTSVYYDVYTSYPMTEWGHYKNFVGQYFPLAICLVVLIITGVLLFVLFSKQNYQTQKKQLIFIINVVSAVVIFLAACMEAWYAAGGSQTHDRLSPHRDARGVIHCTVYRVNAWIVAVGFLALVLVDLILDAIFSRKGDIGF